MDLKIRLRVLQIVEPKLGHGLAMAHSWLNKITWLSFGLALGPLLAQCFFRPASRLMESRGERSPLSRVSAG
jgi:hypothetical protein